MKEWKKPFCKVVLLDESDLIATSGNPEDGTPVEANTTNYIWERRDGEGEF